MTRGFIVTAAVLGALALTLLAPPSERWQTTCRAPFEAPLVHLARCDRGTVVRVSATASYNMAHPLYLIDGRVGGRHEKWTSMKRERAPWLELSWPEPRLVTRVVVHHAGEVEHDSFSTVDFDLSAVDDNGARVTIARVRDNRADVTTHALPARWLASVRLDVLRGARDDLRARLYEIEVLGP